MPLRRRRVRDDVVAVARKVLSAERENAIAEVAKHDFPIPIVERGEPVLQMNQCVSERRHVVAHMEAQPGDFPGEQLQQRPLIE